MRQPPGPLWARGLPGLPEIVRGDDLPALICAAVGRAGADLGDAGLEDAALDDGDVVVVTSKVVSKAEGGIVTMDRDTAVEAETARVVARRGPTTIARTRHGLTLAAAGVDASNTARGTVVLLPADPDASARRLRTSLHATTGRNVAVVISDTAGRSWREGQTDIAIGVAGMPAVTSLAGTVDGHGNALEVTAPAVADEVAGLADLVMGKLSGLPVVVVSGLGDLVLPPDEHGPGAAALIRPDAGDMFGLGSREAVLAAVTRHDPAALGALRRDATTVEDLLALATRSGVPVSLHTHVLADGTVEVSGADDLLTAAALERLLVAATTTQWRLVGDERNNGRCRIVVRQEGAGP
ncbi:MAG TPA: coenzyme F420-0:L-glutamate ligase [Nocardioidaceae bacterium]|nr:coenzyme F420-0:L-glutamate ligase [Nocardioidaceae bacterium]